MNVSFDSTKPCPTCGVSLNRVEVNEIFDNPLRRILVQGKITEEGFKRLIHEINSLFKEDK